MAVCSGVKDIPPNKSEQPLDAFQRLANDLSHVLKGSPNLKFSDIDPDCIISRMRQYISNRREWSKYAHSDKDKCFTRNLVDPGDDRYNLLVLVWSPSKESPIHDHVGSHCIMKMLQGSLIETRYDWPDPTAVDHGHCSPLRSKSESVLYCDEVTYISDKHGLHKILNPHPTEYAVSLHLYAPPNAAKAGCDVFDADTGKATHIIQYDLFSEMGHRKDP